MFYKALKKKSYVDKLTLLFSKSFLNIDLIDLSNALTVSICAKCGI